MASDPLHAKALDYQRRHPGTSYRMARILASQGVKPQPAPWFHEPAMQYMRDNPGTGYDAACELVKSHEGSPGHAKAMAHLRANPGMTYDAACEAVGYSADGSMSLDGVVGHLMKAPPHHEQAMQYMRQHACSYDQAVEKVTNR